MAELMSRFLAVLGLLLALCGAGVRPAQAYPAGFTAVLSGSPCTGKVASLDFAANSGNGVYCLNGTRYSGPTFIPGWSFTRASTGYALNSAGTLVSFGSGVPRITDLGFLPEESRTNLALQSQVFGTTPWARTGATVSPDVTAAPDLTVTADKLVEGSGGTFHLDQQDNTVTANTAYSVGLFVKPAGRSFLKLQASNTAASSGVAVEINLTTGAVSNSTFGTGTIASSKAVAVANGFWWLQLNGVVIDSTSTTLRQQLLIGSASGNYNYSGDGASGVYLWQSDVQAGAVLTSPIPTTSASVTRAADSASIGSVVLPSAYTWTAQGPYTAQTSGTFPTIASSTGNAGLLVAASSMNLGANMGGGGFNSTVAAGLTAGGIAKFAFRALTNDANLAGNGTLATHSTVFTPQSGSVTLYLGSNAGTGSFWNGYVQRFAIFPSAYTDAQLQGATQ